jgi:two-component system, chemotaxis family, sensor kinase CheA
MNDELLNEFVNECREHLATIEGDLLLIEEGGENIDEALVNKVFRAAHSIKGGSGFFGLENVKKLAHKAETILDMLRSRKMVPNAEVTNLLLAAFDQLREMINHTDTCEQADISDLLTSLSGMASSFLPAEQKASLHTEVKLAVAATDMQITVPQMDIERVQRDGQSIYWIDCDLMHDIEKKGHNILALFNTLNAQGEILDCAIDMEAVGTLDGPVSNRIPLRLVIASPLEPCGISPLVGGIELQRIHRVETPQADCRTSKEAAPPAVPVVRAAVKPVVSQAPAAAAESGRPSESTSGTGGHDDTLRVNVGLLETLMNLAGELVLSRNQLRAAVAQNNRQLLSSADQRVNQVTSELQDVIMQTRLQPIGNVLSKFPRVVRDLSRSLGKEVQLEIEGKDVALDKTLIEGLSDPLTHMVRNAVDHGIEPSEERIRAGKKPYGTVRIKARHEAGQVVVEIADDGKGIDPNRVAESALRKGLITEEKLRSLSDRDKQALVFLPGLSTAQNVSDVSGRGVGMDVVKTNLDRLGGQVEITSEVGKGSSFRIKLPLTLAIIPSLIVSAGRDRFAIPQANVEELLRVLPGEANDRIEKIGDSKVLLLRDRVLPLARLVDIIGASNRLSETASPRQETLEIAVLNTGNLSFGLVVGAFHDTEEVVVKPLGQRLKKLHEYSGATILGDGAVALILDAAGLANKAKLAVVESRRAQQLAADAELQRLQEVHSLLLFHCSPQEPCAIHLDMVQRIERIRAEQVERLGNRRTMQYRGNALPLVALSDAAAVSSVDGQSDLVVLVSTIYGREVGLLASMPVDVIETRAVIDRQAHQQKGIAGSGIINNRTVLVVDLYDLVETVHPDWVADRTEKNGPRRTDSDKKTVLLAEDSDFFRAQVKKYLEDDAFNVLDAPDGEAAWDLLVNNLEQVKAVVTDVEMPRLNGLGLTARIRADQRTAELPVIAVSSLAGDEDIARGQQAGVTEYQVKLDRDKLLASVQNYTSQDKSNK